MNMDAHTDKHGDRYTLLLSAAIPILVFALTLSAYLLSRDTVIISAYDQSSPFPLLNRVMAGRGQHSLDHYLEAADRIFASYYFTLGATILSFVMLVLPRRVNLLKNRPLAFIGLLFLAYSSIFIYRTSFVVNAERYFCLFDDAMVSMRYAKNFAAGHGLVWNPTGEPVEGFTNPLWVLYMSLFHLLPAPPAKMALFIQASGVLFLGLALVYVKRLAARFSENDRGVVVAAVFLVAFFFPLLNWSLQGTEVSILTLLVSAIIWGELRNLDRGSFSIGPSLLLGVGTLIRIDVVVLFLSLVSFHLLTRHGYRVRAVIAHTVSVTAFVAGQTLCRLGYYGDMLPNTYYLKMTGYPLLMRVIRGLSVTVSGMSGLGVIFIAVVAAALLLRRDKLVKLLALPVVFQIAYNVFVGGDAWEWWGGANRFLCPFMPLLLIVFADSLKKLYALVVANVRPESLGQRSGAFVYGLLVVLCLLQFNAVGSPRSLEEFLLVEEPLHVGGNEQMVEKARRLRELSAGNAVVAVTWAGSLPYFSERYAIDLLGKSDKVIARQRMHVAWGPETFTAFYPGHLKWDYDYSIRELRPDVVADLWRRPEAIREFLEREYVDAEGMYFRRGSEKLYWPRILEASAADGDHDAGP